MLVGTCSVSAIPPQHYTALCTYHHAPAMEGGDQPFSISKSLLPFVYPSSAPQLHLPTIFRPKTLYHDSSLRGATRTAGSRQDTSTALHLELKPAPAFRRLDPPSTNSTAARPGITITRKKRIPFGT